MSPAGTARAPTLMVSVAPAEPLEEEPAPQADRARIAATPVAAAFRIWKRNIGTLSQNGMCWGTVRCGRRLAVGQAPSREVAQGLEHLDQQDQEDDDAEHVLGAVA